MPDLLGVTNPVPGHDSSNINRNMPAIPNDPRIQNAPDPTRVSGPANGRCAMTPTSSPSLAA